MENLNLYQDIKARTDGDVYIGVVGPVRTGKSTFIKRFMDLLVIPNISNDYKRERAQDELPQSAAGRTIMTTEPKFIPNEAVEITVGGNIKLKTRLVDCVGYLVNNAIGYLEDDVPRMVKTPWSDEEIPFELAAEIGTKKVIQEHSTIGLVVTTDGSITDIPRQDYIEAEERVVNELKELNKPFVIILNSNSPYSDYTIDLAIKLEEKYNAPVIPTDCSNLNIEDIKNIFGRILYEFPIEQINITYPKWVDSLSDDVYISSDNMNGALHGDYVIVELTSKKDLGRLEGRIIRVLKHQTNTFVGEINFFNNIGKVKLDEDKVNLEIIVKKENSLNYLLNHLFV